MQFCFNLKKWVKYDYDSRLLESKISAPLLHKIRNKRDNQIQASYTNKKINEKIITLKNVNADTNYQNYFDIYDDDDEFGIV